MKLPRRSTKDLGRATGNAVRLTRFFRPPGRRGEGGGLAAPTPAFRPQRGTWGVASPSTGSGRADHASGGVVTVAGPVFVDGRHILVSVSCGGIDRYEPAYLGDIRPAQLYVQRSDGLWDITLSIPPYPLLRLSLVICCDIKRLMHDGPCPLTLAIKSSRRPSSGRSIRR